MTIFFTADTHFGHANIIRYCDRPFESKEEHDRVLIENWNSVVKPRDVVYHLGDVGFDGPDQLHKTLQKLNGQIFLLRGNHDGPATREPASSRFGFIKDTHLIRVPVNGNKQKIFLSHYPHRTWPMAHHGSWHLFGHTHNRLGPHGLSLDVGVDAQDFLPISLEALAVKMSRLTSFAPSTTQALPADD